jgi:DNA-binding response OmpR family regulator
MKKILVIEDDISILRGLKDNLEYEGYAVITETNGEKGLQLALNKKSDLILLDIMLPGMNGYEMDKVSGLDTGADDYVTKPFSIPELMARIRAVIRRTAVGSDIPDEYYFGNVKLDFKKLKAFRDNQEIKLSSKEFAIMEYFIRHEGEAVHRHDLLNEVWGYEALPTTRTIDNFILDLRKKFEENPSKPRYIESVRDIGYRFNSLND